MVFWGGPLNGVGLRPRNGLSLCAGGGGLDLGLSLAEPGYHTVCFVEADHDAAATLVAGMLGGLLPGASEHGAGSAGPARKPSSYRPAAVFRPTPVWADLRTFVGYQWRGRIDTVIAGYPCQPFSAAGQRQGVDDERWLWGDIARIISEIDPTWVILENVAGHVSLGAETVLREVRDMGFTPAAGLFTAAETGATHKRQRWFCVAHADGGDPGSEREQCGGEQRFQSGCDGVGGELEHAARFGRGDGGAEPEFRGRRDTATRASCTMAHADTNADARGLDGGADRRGPRAGESQRDQWERFRSGARRGSEHVADTGDTRASFGGADPVTERQGIANQFVDGCLPLHAPGPGETDVWRAVLDVAPDLAPALSLCDVKRVADHAAALVDDVATLLDDRQWQVRQVAQSTLARLRKHAAMQVGPVMTALADSHLEVRKQALIVLGQLGEHAVPALDAIAQQLKEEGTRASAAAAMEMLGRHIGPSHAAAMAPLVAHNDQVLRERALRCLAKKQEHVAQHVGVIVSALKDGHDGVHGAARNALLALGEHGAASHLDAIASMLQAEDSLVRMRGLDALSELGEIAAPKAHEIALRLKDEEAQVRALAVQTLGLLGQHARPHVGAVATLMRDEMDPRSEARTFLRKYKEQGIKFNRPGEFNKTPLLCYAPSFFGPD